eukprot:SAG11_NODE_1154_length_5662_cov_3.473665_5_plen_58_part_00
MRSEISMRDDIVSFGGDGDVDLTDDVVKWLDVSGSLSVLAWSVLIGSVDRGDDDVCA